MRIEFLLVLSAGVLGLAHCLAAAAQPEPRPGQHPADAKARLTTPWTAEAASGTPWPEYPRPTMVRRDWLNLNGTWRWSEAADEGVAPPQTVEGGTIRVPFCFESDLSGVGRHVERAWYERDFEVPAEWSGKRVLLHFGAVDWHAEVWINGTRVGEHKGGYDPFSFDITDALRDEGSQRINVRVYDPTDAGTQPRGKQIRNPHGIWYTPVTGIWQTVWLEPVAPTSIERVLVEADLDARAATVKTDLRGPAEDARVFVIVLDPEARAVVGTHSGPAGEPVTIDLGGHFRPWSPDEPHLYDVVVTLTAPGQEGDTVQSYFGVRKIEVGPDERGVTRILLNGEPTFLHGPLDQGYWPDGLYTPPTDEAMRYDLEITKRLGFNAVRKHVKVEPERWYYWCDKLGLAVMQDMPSGDAYIGPNDPDIERTPESASQFREELAGVIDTNREHPSIVMWVPFNEGWGQFQTAEITELTRRLDPTRLVNPTSGWADRGVGDIIDWHVYPGPGSPRPEAERAALLGEYGGLGLPVAEHLWQERDNWGYRSYDSAEALTGAYENLIAGLRLLIADPGLSGAVYTQTTDVEIEVNGLMTYDRRVLKMNEERVREANLSLLGPAPELRTIAPTARTEAVEWRYTTEDPGPGWQEPGFDDSDWRVGVGGFGREGTPGAIVGTEWTGGEIWIRREFILPRIALHNPHLRIHHDEDAEVYINGVPAARLEGYTTGYVVRPISREAREALIGGPTVIAVRCRQTSGGQFIDAGLVDLMQPGPRD